MVFHCSTNSPVAFSVTLLVLLRQQSLHEQRIDMSETLSLAQARKLVLLSTRLPALKRQAKSATLDALENLSYVQIDTISVVERAHHHCFWSRNPRYRPGDIEALVASGDAFEYWSHAAAYLPMRDFRYSLPRKNALASGELDHWYPRDEREIKEVLARIRSEGPLKARDFEHDKRHKKSGEWHHKPAKRALTYLFMQGDLMCPRREGFQMVYDLRERVLPASVDCSTPSPDEHARHLITRYLQAHGLGQLKDVGHLRKGIKKQLAQTAQHMLEAEELIEVAAANQTYLALPQQLSLLDSRINKRPACILSPFDNLVIQRHRMRELFDFDYQIECYVTAAKRQHGYFVLPILWGGRLVARLDCKADRLKSCLRLHYLKAEDHVKELEPLATALRTAIEEFAKFNSCKEIDYSQLKTDRLCIALRS